MRPTKAMRKSRRKLSAVNLKMSLDSLREYGASYTSDLKIPSKPVPKTFVHGSEVRIALGADKRPMLLLPLAAEELKLKLPQADGLEIEYVQYKGAAFPGGYFLQVSSMDNQLETVFLGLVESICSKIQEGDGSYSSLVDTIEEFRDLLDKSRLPVERSRILGLTGELLFLRQSLASNPDAVNYWVGPQNARRDFLFPGGAFEIKASEQSTGRNVVIHSLAQLDNDDADALFLVYYRLEEDPGKGVTVGDLVGEIRKHLPVKASFDERLNAVGYNPKTSEAWNSFRWSVIEVQGYSVKEGFPRLVASSVQNGMLAGISNVSYQVDLDLAAQHKVSLQFLGDMLEK